MLPAPPPAIESLTTEKVNHTEEPAISSIEAVPTTDAPKKKRKSKKNGELSVDSMMQECSNSVVQENGLEPPIDALPPLDLPDHNSTVHNDLDAFQL